MAFLSCCRSRCARSFTTLMRPFFWMGTFFGAFPFIRSPPSSVSPGSPYPEHSKDVNSLCAGSPPCPTPPYVFKLCSIQVVVCLAWNCAVILFSSINPLYDNSEIKQVVVTITIKYVIFCYIGCFVCSLLMIYGAHGKIAAHLTFLTHLDARLPTAPAAMVRILVYVVFILIFTTVSVTINMYLNLPGGGTGGALFLIMAVALELQKEIFNDFWFYMSWFSQAHLTDKMNAATKVLKDTVAARDATTLKEVSRLVMDIRCACDENQRIFFYPVLASLVRTIFQVVCQVAVWYWMVQSGMNKMNTLFIIPSVMIPILTLGISFSAGHDCMKKAKETELALLQLGDGLDHFSKMVSALRNEMSAHPVVISCGGVFALDRTELYIQSQFLMTIVVVILQFSQSNN